MKSAEKVNNYMNTLTVFCLKWVLLKVFDTVIYEYTETVLSLMNLVKHAWMGYNVLWAHCLFIIFNESY